MQNQVNYELHVNLLSARTILVLGKSVLIVFTWIYTSTCIISTARTHPLTLNENQDLHMIGILCKILDFIPLNVKSED